MDNNDFIFIKSLSWDDVFAIWEANEASDPSWVAHAQSRGFPSWHAWRRQYVIPLGLDKLTWALYDICYPLQIISSFHAGPFKAWAKYYGDKPSVPFRELIQHAGVQANTRLQNIIKNFPPKSTIIGVQTAIGNTTIIEGTHRCLAATYLINKNTPPQMKMQIALATSPLDHFPIIGQPLETD